MLSVLSHTLSLFNEMCERFVRFIAKCLFSSFSSSVWFSRQFCVAYVRWSLVLLLLEMFTHSVNCLTDLLMIS